MSREKLLCHWSKMLKCTIVQCGVLEEKDMKMQLQGFPTCPKGLIKRLKEEKICESLFLVMFSGSNLKRKKLRYYFFQS